MTYRATTIYTTQALACNSTVNQCNSVTDLIDIDVMLVGTDDGKILKIVMTYNGTDHIPLISEELSVSLCYSKCIIICLCSSQIPM